MPWRAKLNKDRISLFICSFSFGCVFFKEHLVVCWIQELFSPVESQHEVRDALNVINWAFEEKYLGVGST